MPREEILEKRLARAKAENAKLQEMIEVTSRSLFLSQEKEREALRYLSKVLRTIGSAVLVVDADGRIKSVNPAACEMCGYFEQDLTGEPASKVLVEFDGGLDLNELVVAHVEKELLTSGGERIPVLFSGAAMRDGRGEIEAVVCVASDLRQKKRMEVDLRHAQKLESVGQLASGIAHEINTPIQFVSDSISFLQDGFADLMKIRELYRKLKEADLASEEYGELLGQIEEEEEELDVEFLEEEIPQALSRAEDGTVRVAGIVGAMKEFAHPGGGDMALADVNHTIETTLTVAKSEYKYVAEITLELGSIPPVCCRLSDINQVVLNLVVNACHAIEDRRGDSKEMGKIGVRTYLEEGDVVIEVSDTGGGIPEGVRERIFDPFFTTKDVGRGTGQGLSIVHNIIVEKHGGRVRFETEEGRGTSFFIHLPIENGCQIAAA